MKLLTNKQLFIFLITLCCMPSAFAHWTTKGPYGGTIKCFTVMDTLMFAGTADGGIYRTTNAAATGWRYYNYTGLSDPHINALTSIGKYVVAATPAGTFKSSDLGNTWVKTTEGLSNTNVLSLITAGDHVIAGTNGGGVYLSHDSGSTWEQSNVGLTNLVVNAFAFDGDVIYAGTQNGVYVSTDDGDSWTAMNTGLSSLSVVSLAVNDTMLYAATSLGVYATNTSTVSWMLSNSGLGSVQVNALSVSGTNLIAATNAGVAITSLSTIAWSFNASTTLLDTVYALASYSGKLYAGTRNNGVMRQTALQATWSTFNTGINNLKGQAIYNSGLLVLAATNKGVFVSKDLAANYVAANTGLADSLHVTGFLFAGATLYASTQYGGVFQSTDTGATWSSANTGLTDLSMASIVGFGSKLLAATTSGAVFYTDRQSINWSACTGVPSNCIPIGFATDTVSHVFLGTQGHGVWMSMDGVSFTASNAGLTNLNVSGLAILGNTLYASTLGAGVFKSGFMNDTWTACNTGLPTQQILSLHASGSFVVAGYRGGVHSSFNGGNLWQAPNVLLYIPEYADVTGISFTPSSSRIFVATPANGFYSNAITELPTTGIFEATYYSALQKLNVFPNPTSGSFTIEGKEKETTISAVSMYDITGKRIHYEQVHAQRVTIESAVKQGIYFVEIQTENGVFVQKVTVH